MHCCRMSENKPPHRSNQSEHARPKRGSRNPEDRDIRLLILFMLAWCLAIAALAVAFMLLV